MRVVDQEWEFDERRYLIARDVLQEGEEISWFENDNTFIDRCDRGYVKKTLRRSCPTSITFLASDPFSDKVLTVGTFFSRRNKMKIVIMRGLPGCGKSTYIKNNFPNAIVCSADHYFLDENGKYNFVPSRIGTAHLVCQREFLTNLRYYNEFLTHKTEGDESFPDYLIVDNTNLALWEMAYYIGLANVFDVPVEVHRIDTPVDVCSARNVHGVPADKIQQMAKRMEKVPPFFANEIVHVFCDRCEGKGEVAGDFGNQYSPVDCFDCADGYKTKE